MGAFEALAAISPIGVCIGTAVGTAAYAAQRAQSVEMLLSLLEEEGAESSGGSGEGGRPPGVGAPLSTSAAIAFPFVASAALLFMFFFYAGVSALLAVVVTLSSSMALSFFIYPMVNAVLGRFAGRGWGGWVPPPAAAADPSEASSALLSGDASALAASATGSTGSDRRRSGGSRTVGGSVAVAATSARCCAALPPLPVVGTGAIVLTALGGWLMTGHWALNNLLGVSQCVLFVSLVRVHAAVTSLRVCTALLAGLFVYDVFWVFASSHLFGTNVMVAVATQDASNPVASAAAALHLPVAPVARLALPVKLVFPTGDGGGLMLGLGDIFVPGLLLGLVLAFDLTTAMAGAPRRRRGCWPADDIFPLALVGYAAGLVCSFVANGVWGVAQPALLYIVPATIGPVVVATASRGDLGELWRGPVVYGCLPGGRGGLPAPATAAGDESLSVCE